MPSGRRIELSLYIVTVSPSESSPCRNGTGGTRGIEAVRQRDSDEVADQVAIMEIVPYVNGCGETGEAQRFGQGITERGSEVREPPVSAGALIADTVDLDSWGGRPQSGALQERAESSVPRLGGIQMRIDEHDRIRATQDRIEMRLVVGKSPRQPD